MFKSIGYGRQCNDIFSLLGLLRLEHMPVLSPSLFRLLQLLLAFVPGADPKISAVFSCRFSWEHVPYLGISFLFQDIYKTLQSVLFEELLLRRYFLYKTIILLGEKKAN